MSNLKDFLGGLDPDTWTDVKAGYLDDNISTKAPASTALSTATWTNTRAGNLDNVDATISSRAPSSTALSTATWTNTRAGYLDSSISSRAPASTALSSNVWTTTYRDRIDTTISSRLGGALGQQLNSNTTLNNANSYSTWTISSINTSKAFITNHKVSSDGYLTPSSWARIVNSTNIRYGAAVYDIGNNTYASSTYASRYLKSNLNQAYNSMLSCMSFS